MVLQNSFVQGMPLWQTKSTFITPCALFRDYTTLYHGPLGIEVKLAMSIEEMKASTIKALGLCFSHSHPHYTLCLLVPTMCERTTRSKSMAKIFRKLLAMHWTLHEKEDRSPPPRTIVVNNRSHYSSRELFFLSLSFGSGRRTDVYFFGGGFGVELVSYPPRPALVRSVVVLKV
jgi:hypothetical protein